MSRALCSRIWIVEAVRDGRVKGTEREAFVRHLANCSDCMRESRFLDDLGDGMRRLSVRQEDVLSVRRERQQLMAESNAVQMKELRPRWRRSLIYSTAIAAGIGMIFGLWRWARHDLRTTTGRTVEPLIEVRPELGARWSQMRTDDSSGVQLEEGALFLRIQRHTNDRRVVIVVPDGEIEDFGTVLRVRVVHGMTTEVIVDEGSVAIRIRGVPELRLGPSQSWTPAPKPFVNAPLPELAPSSSPEHRKEGGDASDVPSARSRRVPTHNSKAARKAQSLQLDDATSSESHDAEDETYLRVISLVRAGRAADARALARDYLLRFPNGFRRVEMLNVVTDQHGQP